MHVAKVHVLYNVRYLRRCPDCVIMSHVSGALVFSPAISKLYFVVAVDVGF